MEDELKKRNTDCVYFLASPLTCKKGVECEFRHSEMARLNPRDCWYWLAGNCLNPTCAFRHPPLEGRSENCLEPASVPQQASVPVSKSSVPCYFYFNGFCNKGDNCSFLHGSNSIPPGPFSKAASTATTVHPLETRRPPVDDGMAASLEPPFNQLEVTTNAGESIQLQTGKEYQPPASTSILQQSSSPQNALRKFDEVVLKSEILLPAESHQFPLGVDQSPQSLDKSSEDHFDGHLEPEERWESSPGFDVLVDDGSEKLGFEDDPEYMLSHKGDDRLHHEHLLHYDYEEATGYELEYSESSIFYEKGIYESYDHPEDDPVLHHDRRVPKRSRDMVLNPLDFQKRHLLSREVYDDENGTDLRNHLQRRRRITGRSKRHITSDQNGRNQERHGRRRNLPTSQGQLAPEVGRDVIGGHSENGRRRRSRSRQSQPMYSRSRQHERERRRQARTQVSFSENSSTTMVSRDTRTTEDSSMTFTAPKTLAQIREEKRKALEDMNDFKGNGTTSLHFEGPKPLSEILKHKKRLGSTSDDNSSCRSRYNISELEMNDTGFDVDNGNLDEY